MTSEATEIVEKLKDKKAEYEAIALSDSSVILDDIDNQIITEVLGPERYGRQYMPSGSQAQAEVQRLRDQMAQIQVSTVDQIAQLKAEAASREVEVQRKYEELQLQLKAKAAARKQSKGKNTMPSSNNFRI
ncbi:Dynein beta chain, ciliary [Gossypium arboreum]|nr:Dynein beta chain, ciliary [Gossypium arboreum]